MELRMPRRRAASAWALLALVVLSECLVAPALALAPPSGAGPAGNTATSPQAAGPGAASVTGRRVFASQLERDNARNRTYQPSFGLFPKGCRWRTVTHDNSSSVTYQYWDFQAETWGDERPAACVPTSYPAPGPPGWRWNNDTPRTEVTCQTSHCVYTNMYYNNGRWYALVDGELYIPSWRFSRNQEVVPFHVLDAKEFIDSVKYQVVPGDTILFDFIFFIHPTAIGHWWEMLGPLYSILKTINFKRPCDQFVLLHLGRQHLLEWVRAMIAVTLGVGLDDELPPVLVQEETDNAWNQITQQLSGFARDTWYVFERVLIVKDLATGGGRVFHTFDDAREFRGLIYRQYGLPPPAPRPQVPRVITFQRKRANRRIVNEPEFVELLKQYGELKIVEYGSNSSLYEQLLQMRETGVYISVHTSNLANAPLLQPGSAVFEIIQRNWMWNGLDRSFKDQTHMMVDIHHYAWRAKYINQTVYLNERDFHKVGHWPAGQCGTEECVEAHTNVDVIVDLAEFKALLDDRLPHVWAGEGVQQASIPWPDW
ncbi:hypothetical protein CHLRE_16g678600v5 [Chlamydomonas reinhardtii]|uniref:Glycosyltransferase 61 catalytic domain-containing protein n=1 Tax=Chlamydomonas reinhardtii TaxID=3055 RepID=A0A2K3CV81_CHLRE|nr:uncharacterized protein CHLRE_16g678600v5 [Chlamydomonas reinhardtii]PNW72188.1 hypothetical protein CHLRE_16g678600v5 [Chlamydomonas reinhardtii]